VFPYDPSWPDVWLICTFYFHVLLLLCILTFEGCISVKNTQIKYQVKKQNIIDYRKVHANAVTGDLHGQEVLLGLHQEAAHLHQVPVQLASPEEELPLQLSVGPVVQQHQQAALGALPLQLGGPWRCTTRNRQGVDLQLHQLV